MKIFSYIAILMLTVFLLACGKGVVEVTNESYEPRLVIEGVLLAGQKVDKIRVSRNFRLGANLATSDMVISDAQVTILDVSAGRTYALTFHESPEPSNTPRIDRAYYRYEGEDWLIEHGKSYTLDVRATVEGKVLHARATTIVPQAGFRIVALNHDSLRYRQRDGNGEVMSFELIIDRSPGTNYYVSVIRPVAANLDNFIYGNAYVDLDPEDVAEDFDDFTHSIEWVQDTPLTAGQSIINTFWWDFWFYSEYEIVTYASDKNYKEFMQTYGDVQEEDGNFHEAKFNFEGEAIGYFGSAVMASARVRVIK